MDNLEKIDYGHIWIIKVVKGFFGMVDERGLLR